MTDHETSGELRPGMMVRNTKTGRYGTIKAIGASDDYPDVLVVLDSGSLTHYKAEDLERYKFSGDYRHESEQLRAALRTVRAMLDTKAVISLTEVIRVIDEALKL